MADGQRRTTTTMIVEIVAGGGGGGGGGGSGGGPGGMLREGAGCQATCVHPLTAQHPHHPAISLRRPFVSVDTTGRFRPTPREFPDFHLGALRL